MDTTQHTHKGHYTLSRNEALRYLGYRGQTYDEALSTRLEEVFIHCEEASQPGWTYRIFPVQTTEKTIELVGTTLILEGKSIYAHLKDAVFCAVMAATCGLANERELARLGLAGGLDALVFDAAGSALVEAAGDACNASVVAQAREAGYFTNYRYGPGYGDLSLDIQPDVVRVCGADKALGMSVTQSNMLIPTKSITALIGLFTTPQDSKKTCTDCTLASYCSLKQKGQTCYR